MMPGNDNSKATNPDQGWRRIFQPLYWLAAVFRVQDLKPAQVGWISGLLFVGCSLLAYQQFRQPYRWHQAYPRFSSAWWLHPAEWNVDAGLPNITGNINAVLLASDGKLWIAGDNGLLAFSEDQGDSWKLLEFDTSGRDFHVPQASSAPASVARSRGETPRWPVLVSTVYAASAQAQAAEQKAKPLVQQYPPPGSQVQQSAPPNAANEARQSAPLIEVRPSSFNFGSVQIGSDNLQKFEFRNIGEQGVTLVTDAPQSKDFRVEKDDCVKRLLQPQESCTVFVAFSPHAVGKTGATLQVRTSQGFAISVAMLGAGQEKPAGIKTGPPPKNPAPAITVWRPPTQPPDLLELEESGKELIAVSKVTEYVSTDNGTRWLARQMRGSLPEDSSQHTTITLGTRTLRVQMMPGGKGPLAAQALDAINKLDGSRYALQEVALDSQRKRGWLVGAKGVVFRTDDGGAHWYPASQSARLPEDTDDPYMRFLPPWYWLALLFCGVLLSPVLSPPGKRAGDSDSDDEAHVQAPSIDVFAKLGDITKHSASPDPSGSSSSIADHAVSDKPLEPVSHPQDEIGNKAISDKPLEPGEPDALGLGAIAAGLAFFLRNDKTRPPLAIGINGRWGSGKSSLMNLLRKDLEDSGSRPVWFNAWHHQKEEQLLAALLQAVKAQAVPPWSSWSGWEFRARLALIRIQRSWFRFTVLGALLFLMYRGEVFLRQSGVSFGSLLHFVFAGPSENKLQSFLDFMRNNPVITLATGVLAALRALSRGLTAFGTNPASLLTTMSGGTKVKDLDAQTSFRQRFAAEFADVTQALGDRRRMLILIDDLDRCRPEKIREVLEAVNFLVSSGDCFIVLGMARDIVEHCVGLSFRRTVDTLSWDAMGLSQDEVERFVHEAQAAAAEGGGNGAGVPGTPGVGVAGWGAGVPNTRGFRVPGWGAGQDFASVEVAAKRRAFARLYLDKLIQIEVAVPEPTLLQKRLLFQTDEEREAQSKNEARAQKVLKLADAGSRWLAPLIQAALVAAVVIATGLLAGDAMKPFARDFFQSPANRNEKPASGPAASTAAVDQGSVANAAISAAGAPPAADREQPRIAPGVAAVHLGWLSFWPFYVVGLAGMGLVSAALRRMPERKVTDTKPFVNALNIWHPLVMTSGAKNTPRTARRFQNRVRYLAMRQRALSRGTPQSQLARWVRKRFKAEAPKPHPLVLLPESGKLPPAIDQEASKMRWLLENGRNGDTQLGTVQQGASGMEVVGNGASPQELDYLLALVRGWVYIPEPLLVALAAIEEYEPQWISDEATFRQFVDFDPHQFTTVRDTPDNQRYALFFEAVSNHLGHWPGWYNLLYYRLAYMQLSNGGRPSPEQPAPPKSMATSS